MVVIVAGRGLGLRPSRELDLYGEASGLKLRKLEKSRRRAFFDVTLISSTTTSDRRCPRTTRSLGTHLLFSARLLH